MKKTITRKEICRIVGRRLYMPAKDVQPIVDELFGKIGFKGSIADPGLIQTAVAHGHEVDIFGFGKFDRRERKAKKNPAKVGSKSSEGTVWIPARHIPYFTANPRFSEYVRSMAAAIEATTEEAGK